MAFDEKAWLNDLIGRKEEPSFVMNSLAMTCTTPQPARTREQIQADIDEAMRMLHEYEAIRVSTHDEMARVMKASGCDPELGWLLVLPTIKRAQLPETFWPHFVRFRDWCERPIFVNSATGAKK